MPTRSYTNSSLLDLATTNLFEQNATITPSNFNISAIGSAGVMEGAQCTADITRTGELDFTAFPSIPDSATITRVRVRLTIVASVSQSGNVGSACQFGLVLSSPVGTIATIAESDTNIIYTTPIDYEYLTPMTRAELISLFTAYTLAMTSFAGGTLSAGINTTLSNFTVDVTYDLEHYSWYIKPTVRIVDGKPLRVVESEDDILAVPDGDTPPEGYEFYGTGDDYPDGPEYVWWYSEEWYLMYIYSPIDPAIEDLPYVWGLVGGVPTCTNCTSVTLGTLTILVADASGVYQLDLTATHDQVYVREGFSIFVEAESVKIPNPFGKTGFVP